MLFNSFSFWTFFPLVLVASRLVHGRPRHILLLIASWYFYAWWDWRFLFLLLFSTSVDYGLALVIERTGTARTRRALVAASVVTNLVVLGVFKYAGFFVREAASLLQGLGLVDTVPVLSVVLPIGLSFYTFQSMGYVIDVYRGETAAVRDFVLFALFVSFFPQLVAGPIERSQRLVPQLAEGRQATGVQFAEGAHLVLLGLYKKVFVADNLAPVVAQVFESRAAVSGGMVLVATYAFTWQIYCDFSGYTDIARGLGKWLGVDLSENFRLPFFASNPRDLWRRWHVSLSEWLRDYLYIPLGGSRHGRRRTLFNLAATMVLGGLWHGAAWTYVAWGAYHGTALVAQRVAHRVLPSRPMRLPACLTRVLSIVLMFHVTALGFLVFRAHSLSHAGTLLWSLATGWSRPGEAGSLLAQLAAIAGFLLALELIAWWRNDRMWLIRLPAWAQAAVSAWMFVAIVWFGASYGRQFIYFRF